MSLVLASASQSRRALLTAAGVGFSVDPADLDEAVVVSRSAGGEAVRVATDLAQQKALLVSSRQAKQLVLGADSIIVFQDRCLGKCATLAQARTLLSKLSGHEHLLVCAAALARDGALLWSHASRCAMSMRPLSSQFLDFYLAAEGPAILSAVGCYLFEGRGAQLFDWVQGDYFSILGLPLLPVLAQLRKEGVLLS